MQKFIPFILLFCLFTDSCTKESINDAVFSYSLVQNYTITATKNKTYVKAEVYYQPDRQTIAPRFASKVEFNGIEMNRGLSKYEPDDALSCLPKEKSVKEDDSRPEISLAPITQKTPEPVAQESDFYIVADGYRTENTITITNPKNKSESYRIKFEPIDFKDSESIKISRSKDNIVPLKGKGSIRKEDFRFFLTQGNGIFVNEKTLLFDPVENVIKIPAKLIKNFKKGAAIFYLNSSNLRDPIPTPKVGGNGFSVSFASEICVEITD